MTPETRQALDEHDEHLAQEFEAMAERLREREADKRARKEHGLAMIYAAQARENVIAAKHCRSHIDDRAFAARLEESKRRGVRAGVSGGVH